VGSLHLSPPIAQWDRLNTYANTYAYANANAYAYSYTYANSNTYANTYTYSYAKSNWILGWRWRQ
jgi:hypothetical protein